MTFAARVDRPACTNLRVDTPTHDTGYDGGHYRAHHGGAGLSFSFNLRRIELPWRADSRSLSDPPLYAVDTEIPTPTAEPPATKPAPKFVPNEFFVTIANIRLKKMKESDSTQLSLEPMPLFPGRGLLGPPEPGGIFC